MIYITGDTHADFKRFSNKNLNGKGLLLTEKDYVIICGDFGLCWKEDSTFSYNCRFFEEKPYTILWVQGNHENYDMLENFPLEKWKGGMVRHIVRDKVILLERGQVFDIEGQKFFTFGGASSHDIQGGVFSREDKDFKAKIRMANHKGLPYRVMRESWWPEELPTKEELQEGLKNLESKNNEVDYVISHCCATSIQNILDKGPGHLYKADILTEYLDELEKKIKYKHWFFGHYHEDRKVDDKHTLLYHKILCLNEISS